MCFVGLSWVSDLLTEKGKSNWIDRRNGLGFRVQGRGGREAEGSGKKA